MRKLSITTAAIALVAVTGLTGTAGAVDVTVNNPSFEDDALAGENTWTTVPPQPAGPGGVGITDWTVTNTGTNDGWAGAFNPNTDAFTTLPDGVNVLYSSGPTVSQTLTETLSALTKYTLMVEVGDRKETTGIFADLTSYKVQLWAGATMLAEDDNSLDPADDQFLTSTVTFYSFGSHPELGSNLEIRLLSGDWEAIFDDVRLTAEAITVLYVDADGMVDLSQGTDEDICAGTGNTAYTTVQAAIDDAALVAGSPTVKVCPGTYAEDLIIGVDNLMLMGVNMSASIIQGIGVATDGDLSNPGIGFPAGPYNVDIQADGVRITNLTIQSPVLAETGNPNTGEYSHSIVLSGENIRIDHNYFYVSSGLPGSVAIQTWSGFLPGFASNSIDGLKIDHNTFMSSTMDTQAGFGYEGVFINPQGAAIGDDVYIKYNGFSGNLYRGVGLARGDTKVKHNTFATDLTPSNQVDFGSACDNRGSGQGVTGNNVPVGVKAFVPMVKISYNSVNSGGEGQFECGIVLADGVTDSMVKGNEAHHAYTDGIHLQAGADNNEVANNSTNHNEDDGVQIGSDGNDVHNNSANNNTDNGFAVLGSDNDLDHNTANNNGDRGIAVNGDGNTLSQNTTNNNGTDGVRIQGSNNVLNGNVANENDEDGIDGGNVTNACPINGPGNIRNRAKNNGDDNFEGACT